MNNTGYWIFYCNPKLWEIDSFLEEGTEISTWKVTDWQKKYFKKGQLGLVRVGTDRRTLKELNGKKRLDKGVYAVVEILEEPIFKEDIRDSFWLDDDKPKENAWRVKIKYVKNLINKPVLIENLAKIPDLKSEKALIEGTRNSTWSISEKSFKKVIEQSKANEKELEEVNNENIYDEADMIALEAKYKNQTPKIREIISKKIERGTIATAVKKWYDYDCLICKAKGEQAKGFKKKNGEYYIETHHFFPVSELQKGSLGLSNLMTLCANHHRQVHYGNIQLLSSDKEYFELKIDNTLIKIKKKTTANKSNNVHSR